MGMCCGSYGSRKMTLAPTASTRDTSSLTEWMRQLSTSSTLRGPGHGFMC